MYGMALLALRDRVLLLGTNLFLHYSHTLPTLFLHSSYTLRILYTLPTLFHTLFLFPSDNLLTLFLQYFNISPTLFQHSSDTFPTLFLYIVHGQGG